MHVENSESSKDVGLESGEPLIDPHMLGIYMTGIREVNQHVHGAWWRGALRRVFCLCHWASPRGIQGQCAVEHQIQIDLDGNGE